MTPFDALLCERSLYYEAQWSAGFDSAAEFVRRNPKRSQEIHAVVVQGLSGHETARYLDMLYDPLSEGFWHGVYGEVEYQRWASR